MKTLLVSILTFFAMSAIAADPSGGNEPAKQLQALSQDEQVYTCMTVFADYTQAAAQRVMKAGTEAERKRGKQQLDLLIGAFMGLEFVYSGLDEDKESALRKRHEEGDEAEAMFEHCHSLAKKAINYSLEKDAEAFKKGARELRGHIYRTHRITAPFGSTDY
jgi:hypothetical protein